MKRAIKTHAMDFVAIVGLLFLSIVVAGYVLNHERFRFPFIQSSPFTINAAVLDRAGGHPGPGPVGPGVGRAGRRGRRGDARRTGSRSSRSRSTSSTSNLIHKNWTALLRPKTGLKDMFIELAPGRGSAPVAKPGFTIPVSEHQPRHRHRRDPRLARRRHPRLSSAAGQRRRCQGSRATAAASSPRCSSASSPRTATWRASTRRSPCAGADLRQLVNSLQRLNTALATNQGQISSLVDSSAKVFHAFASEDGNISARWSICPARSARRPPR